VVDVVALGKFFLLFEHFGCPLSVSFHQCDILMLIYVLLSPEGHRAKPGNLQNNAVSAIGKHWT
jgi:hypothetical protein